MIREMRPVSMPEALDIAGDSASLELKAHFKKFIKLKAEKALELAQDIRDKNMLKVKETHIVAIVDTVPEDAQDLNKVFTDVSLDENETNTLLELIKKYR